MKTYSTATILQYLSGQLSREEVFALERAMLDDDLLADAVEGYKLMRETMSDEAILSSAARAGVAQQPREEKKAAPAPVISLSRGYKWLGYAAAACLIAGAGWWIFSLSDNNALPAAEDAVTMQEIVTAAPDSNGLADIQENTAAALPDTKNAASSKNSAPAGELAGKKPLTQKPAPTAAPPPAITAIEQNATAEKGLADVQLAEKKPAAAAMARMRAADRTITAADTANAIPAIGWNAYVRYVQSAFEAVGEIGPGKAILTLGNDGIVLDVKVSGDFSDTATAALQKIFREGPVWKNKTNVPTKAALSWQ